MRAPVGAYVHRDEQPVEKILEAGATWLAFNLGRHLPPTRHSWQSAPVLGVDDDWPYGLATTTGGGEALGPVAWGFYNCARSLTSSGRTRTGAAGAAYNQGASLQEALLAAALVTVDHGLN